MSSKTTSVALTLLVLTAASPALARPLAAASPSRGFEMGVRLGIAWSGGMTGFVPGVSSLAPGDYHLSDFASTQVPLWVDVGYRFNPNWYLGGYLQYGFARVNNNAWLDCQYADSDCSARDVRLGINAIFHFKPELAFSPWLGLGAGFEWFTMKWDWAPFDGRNWQDVTFFGVDYLNLQFGADGHVSRNFSIGPFISYSLGQYQSLDNSWTGGGQSTDIYDTATHQWLWLGVRGVFNP